MNTAGIPFLGEGAALLAALFWAVATIIFKRVGKRVAPLEMNLAKGLLGTFMLLVTLGVRGMLDLGGYGSATIWLLISGAVGIGLGDTFYFASLRHLGSRRALLMGVLAPPLAGLIAFLALDESLSLLSIGGIALAVIGVLWVLNERRADDAEGGGRLGLGVLFGFLAALGQGGGAVISHHAMLVSEIDVFQSALLRLLAGLVVVLGWLLLRRRPLGNWWHSADAPGLWGTLAGVTFFGTFLALVLQQTALRFSSAVVAQTLLSTSPLFILPIARGMGHRVSPRAWLGVLLALGGIAILFAC
jgi:drug/metabolite transporter (DMT)-like permease